MACQSLDLELTDFVQFDRCNEPYFENDIYNEVGHAFEENVSTN
jgi:hypothetical protein